jgi:hypothetical protein
MIAFSSTAGPECGFFPIFLFLGRFGIPIYDVGPLYLWWLRLAIALVVMLQFSLLAGLLRRERRAPTQAAVP